MGCAHHFWTVCLIGNINEAQINLKDTVNNIMLILRHFKELL